MEEKSWGIIMSKWRGGSGHEGEGAGTEESEWVQSGAKAYGRREGERRFEFFGSSVAERRSRVIWKKDMCAH